ncbi:MFS transporter, partial [Streptomyces sp. NPDC052727]|uniref:MFS transporter n=1 Tax=Streptomyces sp. NPDC052727 TaxID=3154854 RepID=UPI00342E35C7
MGLSDGAAPWVVNAYGLAFGALLLAGGRAADLPGRRRTLLAGLTVFGAASVVAGLAPSAGPLIAARAVQGAGAAVVAPAALTLVLDVFPPGPVGVWGAVSGAGAAAGVLLGGLLTQLLGWAWPFHTVALGTALVAGGVTVLVPRVPGGTPGRFDLLGTAAVTSALTAPVWGLTAARGTGWSAPQVLTAFALGGLSIAPRTVRPGRPGPPPHAVRAITATS